MVEVYKKSSFLSDFIIGSFIASIVCAALFAMTQWQPFIYGVIALIIPFAITLIVVFISALLSLPTELFNKKRH